MNFAFPFEITEKRSADEVLRLPVDCAPELHSDREREGPAGLQAHLPGRGHPAVPGADHHAPPLGASQAGEGQVQAVRKGRVTSSTTHFTRVWVFHIHFLSYSRFF